MMQLVFLLERMLEGEQRLSAFFSKELLKVNIMSSILHVKRDQNYFTDN